jgi:hypothetical protein
MITDKKVIPISATRHVQRAIRTRDGDHPEQATVKIYPASSPSLVRT